MFSGLAEEYDMGLQKIRSDSEPLRISPSPFQVRILHMNLIFIPPCSRFLPFCWNLDSLVDVNWNWGSECSWFPTTRGHSRFLLCVCVLFDATFGFFVFFQIDLAAITMIWAFFYTGDLLSFLSFGSNFLREPNLDPRRASQTPDTGACFIKQTCRTFSHGGPQLLLHSFSPYQMCLIHL